MKVKCPSPPHTRRFEAASPTAGRQFRCSHGQATIELLGSLPLLVLIGLCAAQAFVIALGMMAAQATARDVARARDFSTSKQLAATAAPVPAGFRAQIAAAKADSGSHVLLWIPHVVPGVARDTARISAKSRVRP